MWVGSMELKLAASMAPQRAEMKVSNLAVPMVDKWERAKAEKKVGLMADVKVSLRAGMSVGVKENGLVDVLVQKRAA